MKKLWLVSLVLMLICFLGLSAISFYIPSTSVPSTNDFVSDISFPVTVQDVLPSVVHIQCPRWQGSGVAITENIVATARHVVDGKNYIITLNDGSQVRGIQAISHSDYDIGFIKVDKKILKPARFGSIKDTLLGQRIFIIGSPFGKINFNSVTLGVISGLNRDWNMTDPWSGEKYGWKIAFTSDSAAHPGNSGGAVFTMDGVVRGLLVGGFSPVLNCSMPCDLFLDDIETIKLMFVFDNYKTEKDDEEVNYFRKTESREDYYQWD